MDEMSLQEIIRTDWLLANKEHRRIEAAILGKLVNALKRRADSLERDLSRLEIIAEIDYLLSEVLKTGEELETSGRLKEIERNILERATLLRYVNRPIPVETIKSFHARNAELQHRSLLGLCIASLFGFSLWALTIFLVIRLSRRY